MKTPRSQTGNRNSTRRFAADRSTPTGRPRAATPPGADRYKVAPAQHCALACPAGGTACASARRDPAFTASLRTCCRVGGMARRQRRPPPRKCRDTQDPSLPRADASSFCPSRREIRPACSLHSASSQLTSMRATATSCGTHGSAARTQRAWSPGSCCTGSEHARRCWQRRPPPAMSSSSARRR